MYETIFKKITVPDNIHLNKISTDMIHDLTKLIFNSHDQYNNTALKQQTFKVQTINNDFIHNIPDFQSYPEDIQIDIEKMNKICISFSFTINTHDFTVFIITDPQEKIDIDNYFEYIYRWLFVATTFSSSTCSKKLHLYLTTTNLEKNLPKNKQILDQINCNSAFTTSCKPSTTIHIYRKEEWFKVFIHETFHCLGLDFSHLKQHICKNIILSAFPIRIDIRLYECYTEIFAEIIHLLFFCCNKRKTQDTVFNLFKKELKQMQTFSFFQCAKILNHYDLEINQLRNLGSRYTENTAVFSYYILKSMMLFHISDFINWCSKHNKTIQFNNTQTNLKDFCLFIKKTIESPKHSVYNNIINNTIHIVHDNDDGISDMYKNLKMTIIEFP